MKSGSEGFVATLPRTSTLRPAAYLELRLGFQVLGLVLRTLSLEGQLRHTHSLQAESLISGFTLDASGSIIALVRRPWAGISADRCYV